MSGATPLVAPIPANPDTKVKDEDKPKQGAQAQNFNNHNQNQNRGGGGGGFDRGKRKRGGGPMGLGRNSFMGRGGGGGGPFHGGGGFERRSFPGDFDGPLSKKSKMQSPEFRVLEKLRAIQGPTIDLPAIPFELKKFLANTRLYIGNIAPDVTEAEIKDLFATYGEVDEVFINRDKNFAFLKLDFRTNAERARAELDQYQLKNRMIKVRFAPATVRVKVKNLNPMVSNELLELAFGIFGEIERALVFVDEKGKSTGEGIVDFTRKNNAAMAHKTCSEKCFFITSDLRPVVTEIGDMCEMDEGLLEMNLPKRDYRRGLELDYHKAREIGPRFAEDGSFEADYGDKWKALVQEYKKKELALKEELEKEVEKLHTQIEMARYDYETEMLRQQLRQREQDHERHKMEYEGRVPRDFLGRGGGGFANGSAGNAVSRQPAMDNQQMTLEQMEGGNGDALGGGNSGGSIPSLAPPPMPPQGLMAHLQNEQATPAAATQGPTWELPSVFGRGRGSGTRGLVRSELTEHYSTQQSQHSDLGVLRELKEDDFVNEVAQGGILLPNPLARHLRNAAPSPDDDDDCVILVEESNEVPPPTNRSRLANYEQDEDKTFAVPTRRDYFPQPPNEFSQNRKSGFGFPSVNQPEVRIQRRSPSPPDSLFAKKFMGIGDMDQQQHQRDRRFSNPPQISWETPVNRVDDMKRDRFAPAANQGVLFQDREFAFATRKSRQVGAVNPWQMQQRPAFGNPNFDDRQGNVVWENNLRNRRSADPDVDDEGEGRVYRNPIQVPELGRKGTGRNFRDSNQNVQREIRRF